MSRIFEATGLIEMYGVLEKEVIQKIEEEMKLKAYKENRFEDLVNINPYLEMDTVDVGDLAWTEDYDIMSGSYRTLEGDYLDSEEDFDELWNEEKENCRNEFEIVKTESGFEVLQNGELLDTFSEKEDAENFIEEEVIEMAIEKIGGASLYDLEYESDELYWTIVVRFNDYVDEENAKKAGLIIVDFKDELYMGLPGCGMDMSHLYMKYLIFTHKALTSRFANKQSLKWLKTMVGNEKFIELMVECGLDEELLRKYLK